LFTVITVILLIIIIIFIVLRKIYVVITKNVTINYNCNYFSLSLSLFFSVLLEIFSCIYIGSTHLCRRYFVQNEGKGHAREHKDYNREWTLFLACLEGRLMNKFLTWTEKAIASRKIASQENWYPIRSLSSFSLSLSLFLFLSLSLNALRDRARCVGRRFREQPIESPS